MKCSIASLLALLTLVGCSSSTTSSTMSNQPSENNGVYCISGVDCHNRGLEYVSRGDYASYSIASRYFHKSCDYGESQGCNNLAFLYANARGVRQSYTLAYRYWGKACSMGNSSACNNLQLAKEKVAKYYH